MFFPAPERSSALRSRPTRKYPFENGPRLKCRAAEEECAGQLHIYIYICIAHLRSCTNAGRYIRHILFAENTVTTRLTQILSPTTTCNLIPKTSGAAAVVFNRVLQTCKIPSAATLEPRY